MESSYNLAIKLFAALIISAHILEVGANKDVGTTTAFAMMLSFVLAAWAVYGHSIPAMAVTVVVISLVLLPLLMLAAMVPGCLVALALLQADIFFLHYSGICRIL